MIRLSKILMWANFIAMVWNFSAMMFLPPYNPLALIHIIQFIGYIANWVAMRLMFITIKRHKEMDKWYSQTLK